MKDELLPNSPNRTVNTASCENQSNEEDLRSGDKDENENEYEAVDADCPDSPETPLMQVSDASEFKIEDVRGSIANLSESPSPLQMYGLEASGDGTGYLDSNGNCDNKKPKESPIFFKDGNELNEPNDAASEALETDKNPGFAGSIQNILYCDLCDTAFISEEFVLEHIRKYHRILKKDWKQFVSDHCL